MTITITIIIIIYVEVAYKISVQAHHNLEFYLIVGLLFLSSTLCIIASKL